MQKGPDGKKRLDPLKKWFKTSFATSISFSSSLFFYEGIEKGLERTSCRTFSDPIDYHRPDLLEF